MAIGFIDICLQARTILRAISPLLAIKIEEIFLAIFPQASYRLMFPCFLGGLMSLLSARLSRARMIDGLVSIGSITTSIMPFSAAIYGLANLSLNSLASFFLVAIASGDCFRSFR